MNNLQGLRVLKFSSERKGNKKTANIRGQKKHKNPAFQREKRSESRNELGSYS